MIPAPVINTFRTNCTPENLKANVPSILWCLALLVLTSAIAFLLAPRFSKDPAIAKLYRYSLVIPNFGFMGNALVQGLFGDAVLFRYLVFTMPALFFVYSIGFLWLTAGKEKFTWKKLLNPSNLSLVIGMILTGFVIGKSDLLMLLTSSGYRRKSL